MLRGRAVISGVPPAGIVQDLQQDRRGSRCETRGLARYNHPKTVGVVRGSELRPTPMGWTPVRWRGW